MEKKTEYACTVCYGIIIERSEIPYIPAVHQNLIGPGSANVATEANRRITGWHCDSCGIAYHKPPNTKLGE